MRSGVAPPSTSCATRCASVLVLPVPAPAMMSSGAAGARRFALPPFRRSKVVAVLTAGTIGYICIFFQ